MRLSSARLVARIAIPAAIVGSSLLAVTPAAHAAPSEYVALAWSSPSGSTAAGWGDSAQQAIDRATDSCYQLNQKTNCRSYIWAHDGYVALATDNATGRWGSYWATSPGAANDGAMRECGSTCKVARHEQSANLPGGDASGGLPGRVCIFASPQAVGGLGHAGWAFRTKLTGPDEEWTVGATEAPDRTWSTAGLTSHQALAAFQSGEVSAGEYRVYRCQDTAQADSAAAGAKAQQVDTRNGGGYFLIGNNCLTKSVAILDAYGSTAPMLAADSAGMAPNVFISIWLDGFLPVAPVPPISPLAS
jgi:hypothetical protein